MTVDNRVTEFPKKPNEIVEITLDGVMLALANWRANKGTRGEQIPNDIWQSIFLLVKKYPDMPVTTMLGITKMQLQRKLDERTTTTDAPAKPREYPRMDFCEPKEETSLPYKPARIPATNTLIVEFCRADGRIMKIHTTTDSFAELMKAFFTGT